MLAHRGPDYCGTHSDDNVFLGHTRLSILDLTEAGNQPFGDDKAQLVFNGEIYNWRQLRAQYLPDAELHSRSDTEVVFLLLREMGPGCLALLDGMFALAYFDACSRKLVLARDLVGIKPLYFVPGPPEFQFSSEVKNLDYRPDLDKLKEYLVFGRFGEDFLPYSNVREVLPGNYLEVDCNSGAWAQRPYREVEDMVSKSAYTELASSTNLVDRLDELLQRSVAMHEQSDAPIGFLCSGGLDSSLITAMAAKRHPDVSLYHADFEGEGRELHFAEQVASHVGAPLRKSHLTKKHFWELFPEVTHAMDLPIQHPHSLSLCLIARQARADGLKVLLAGEGADEMFAGYWFYPAYARSLTGTGRSRGRELASKVLRRFLTRVNPDPDPYWFFSEFSRPFQTNAHVGFGDAYSLADPIRALSLVGQNFKAWSRWQQAVKAFDWLGDRREASVLSFQLFYARYHLQPLLQRLDRMLMIHSIEGRVPFLENDLIRFAVNLEVSQKFRGNNTKWILKQLALRYLPANVVNRRKVGFTVPYHHYVTRFPEILENGFVSEWMRLTKGELSAWCGNDVNEIYRLISIEVWGRIFVYGVPWTEIQVAA